MKRKYKFAIIAVGALAVIGGGWLLYHSYQSKPKVIYRTAKVHPGDITSTISATGTVEPEEVVDVGAQVAGRINSFGKDKDGKSVDYGSFVEEGTILAQIDDSLYAADVELAKAQLGQAQASKDRAEADLLQMQAKFEQAQKDWERAQSLGPSEALAPTSYDAFKAGFEIAKANVAVDKSAVKQAEAAVAQAQAQLDRNLRNLDYCTIKSPVSGVIIDRRVNIGQTVVSSLSAPSLFLIAKDLRRIQVWVSVNEADVGSINPGIPVNFTADAFPNRTFEGVVGKVRLNASMTQNVVTYTVEVNTDNSDGRLLPYLTANVQFLTGHRENVLLVPNAALRWNPRPDQIAPEYRQQTQEPQRPGRQSESQPATAKSSSRPDGQQAASQPTTRRSSRASSDDTRHGTIWVKQGEFVKPIRVRLGLTDGMQTEIRGQDVADGLEVITGEQAMESSSAAPAGDTSKSPFAPQLPSRRPAGGTGNQGGSGGAPGGAAGGR